MPCRPTAQDGDEILGLTVITTPGHTRGHISPLDPVGRVLIAGSAASVRDGTPEVADPASSEDSRVHESSKKLAALDFDRTLFNHSAPIEAGHPKPSGSWRRPCPRP